VNRLGRFQLLVGFPTMGRKIFRVGIKEKEAGKLSWMEFVPALNMAEAERKAKKAMEELSKEEDFYKGYEPVVKTSFFARFDGGETPAKWKAYGIPEGKVPDQYIAACVGRGINLNIFKIGSYVTDEGNGCAECEQKEECIKEAQCAGEQAGP